MIDQNFIGIVLAQEPRNESDSRVAIFTKELGLVRALAQSTKKPLSKLAAHLEPPTMIRGRFIEKRQPRIVDAVQEYSFSRIKKNLHCYDESIRVLRHVHDRLGELQQDENLWTVLCESLHRIEAITHHMEKDAPKETFRTVYANIHRALGY